MPKPLLLLPVVLLIGYCPAFAAPPAPQAGASAQHSGKASGEVPAHVKKIYDFDCAICHGATGNGKTDLAASLGAKMDDWTDPKALDSKTDEQLFDIIRKGKDKMPAEDPTRAKNDDVHGLINYIRSMSKGTPAEAPATTTGSTAN